MSNSWGDPVGTYEEMTIDADTFMYDNPVRIIRFYDYDFKNLKCQKRSHFNNQQLQNFKTFYFSPVFVD